MFLRKKGRTFCFCVVLLIAALVLIAGCGRAPADQIGEVAYQGYILLATTTSTYDSGLLGHLIPVFTAETGIEVRVLSRGTGAALELGQRGDADVLLVHDRASELRLVEEGYFTDRYDVMYNDFIIVGPPADPAGIAGIDTAAEALAVIARGGHPFISRGDDSGTHRLEKRLWGQAGIDPAGSWYLSVGQGMGETLRMANEKSAYTVTDRGTFLFLKRNLNLVMLLEGDPPLLNQYGVMAVNPARHAHVQYERALQFIAFLNSEKGQELIASYKIEGETLFFPGMGLPE